MTYHSVIRNFANIGTEQAEKLRVLLSLSMPVEMLKFCGSYYKNQLKRDPFVDEIKMLDKLVSARERDGAFSALTEFFTNDAFVARTYADLIKKRKLLYPDLVRPATLREAANVASEYIHRSRGEDESTCLLPSIENASDCISYPDASCVAAPNSALRLRMLPLAHTKIAEGDVLILVSATGNDVQAVFARKVAVLLQDKELIQYVKGVSTVGRGGILQELLHLTDGVQIQLSALSPIGTTVPVTTLCDGFVGSKILRVAAQNWNIVTSLLAKSGVRALPFASVKNNTKFVFARDKKSAFELDALFLRTLNRYKPAAAKLGDECTLSPDKIAFGGIGGGKCDYLVPNTAEQIGEVVSLENTLCAAASSKPENTPYKTALWSTIAPIAALCTCGIPYDKQTLSLALEIPENLSDCKTVGKCVASILGLYRVQVELGIKTAGRVPIYGVQELKSPSLSAWTLAQNAKSTPATFTKSGSFVYAVAPKLDKDGLPDFTALRQMLNQIAKFASEGKILSARTLVGEAVTDGIRKMSLTHTCVLSDKRVAAEGALPLCILIESLAELPLAFIGKVHPFIPMQKNSVEIPNRTELIACNQPDVVIVSSLTDSNAMALAALLEGRGAHVSLFTKGKASATELARAILTTQTLILCSNAKLPETKQMEFALDSIRRAGGILLSLSKDTAPEGFVSLKNGMSEDFLQKICN